MWYFGKRRIEMNNLNMTDKDIVIKIENLTKIYKLYDAPIDRLKESLHWQGKKYHKDFYALNDVSFEVKKGECIGILGKNGAGKSTLLKIITGVLTPTSGKVVVNGRVSALLELGAGFNPEYTGMENIYFQGAIMGYERSEIDAKVDEILAFADIGAFIHQPFKTYSSGMGARLAFAVAINVEPEILIVDEALSVGDMFFQAKSMSKMKQLIENEKTTVLFVSHDITSIKALCSNAILLDNGSKRMIGKASNVADEYFAMRFESATSTDQEPQTHIKVPSKSNIISKNFSSIKVYSNEEFKKNSEFQRIRNGKANFTNVVLLNKVGALLHQVEFGETITLRCFVKCNESIHNLAFGFHVRSKNGVEILYDDTVLQKQAVIFTEKNEEYIVDWKFKVNLQAAHYNIAVVCSIPINLEVAEVDMCDFIPIAKQFEVIDKQNKIYAAVHANANFVIAKSL